MTAEPFRTATADEAAAVARLINAAFEVERFFIEGDRTSADEVRALMARGSFRVAGEDGGLVGCVYRPLGYAETGTAPFPDAARAKRPCHFIRMSKPLEAERG